MSSESSVNTSAHASPIETSRHWARQSGIRCRIVGQRVRSEGSTFVTGRSSPCRGHGVVREAAPRVRGGKDRPAGLRLEPDVHKRSRTPGRRLYGFPPFSCGLEALDGHL